VHRGQWLVDDEPHQLAAASISHGIAAPIAHTSGALRLGRFAGSTRSIGRPSHVQAFGDTEEPKGSQSARGDLRCDLRGGGDDRLVDVEASPWLTIVARPAASTLRSQSALVP
jgi:hypothetical protein